MTLQLEFATTEIKTTIIHYSLIMTQKNIETIQVYYYIRFCYQLVYLSIFV